MSRQPDSPGGVRGKAFYDYGAGTISNPFRLGRIICTRQARKWYYLDYCKKMLKLTLRDVTDEIATLLEWEEIDLLTKDKDARKEHLEKMREKLYFGYWESDDAL